MQLVFKLTGLVISGFVLAESFVPATLKLFQQRLKAFGIVLSSVVADGGDLLQQAGLLCRCSSGLRLLFGQTGFFCGVGGKNVRGGFQFLFDGCCGAAVCIGLQLWPLFAQQLEFAIELRVITNAVQMTGLRQQLFYCFMACCVGLLLCFLFAQAVFCQTIQRFIFALSMILQLLQFVGIVDAFSGCQTHTGDRVFHGQLQTLGFITDAGNRLQTQFVVGGQSGNADQGIGITDGADVFTGWQ